MLVETAFFPLPVVFMDESGPNGGLKHKNEEARG
jgi:hypothetical protein